jgi:hypothetical protein
MFDIDLVNIICFKAEEDINRCSSPEQGNRSIDIRSIDYFSDGKTLDAIMWLVSEIKNISFKDGQCAALRCK